jgi:glutathione S-transferase
VRAIADGSALAVSELPVLYVICGSHACRTGMLMLAHKDITYRTVVLRTGPHPLGVRMRGFAGHREPIRKVEGRTPASLAMLDRGGTVPALRYGSERIQTNRRIARFLDREVPERPLLPLDPSQRVAVEEAERWGDEQLQMTARRVLLATAAQGLDTIRNRGSDGRLGPLLAAGQRERLLASRMAGLFFRARGGSEEQLLPALPSLLDRVDEWIGAGVLNGPELNVADFMIAPCLALLDYRADLAAEMRGRPCGALLDRLLPEPASARS